MRYRGNFLKQKRGATGLTVRELGEAVGVSYSLISKFENGTRKPSNIVLQRLRKELSLTYEDFKILRKEHYSCNTFNAEIEGGEVAQWKTIEIVSEFKSIYRII